MKRLVVHIDRLVLNGFRPEDGAPVGEGVRTALTEALGAPDVGRQLARRGDVARMSAGSIETGPRETASQAGSNVGRAIAKRVAS